MLEMFTPVELCRASHVCRDSSHNVAKGDTFIQHYFDDVLFLVSLYRSRTTPYWLLLGEGRAGSRN